LKVNNFDNFKFLGQPKNVPVLTAQNPYERYAMLQMQKEGLLERTTKENK
jgi:hypothetical protein